METNYLTIGPISPATISQLIEKMNCKTDCGALSMFLGQVRADEVDGKKVKAIEYSALIELVNIESEKIIKEIFSEFGDVKAINVIHSTGVVRVAGISLLVLVAAGHRHQAMKACSKAVELIKERLPVWKKEIFEDDSHIWK